MNPTGQWLSEPQARGLPVMNMPNSRVPLLKAPFGVFNPSIGWPVSMGINSALPGNWPIRMGGTLPGCIFVGSGQSTSAMVPATASNSTPAVRPRNRATRPTTPAAKATRCCASGRGAKV